MIGTRDGWVKGGLIRGGGDGSVCGIDGGDDSVCGKGEGDGSICVELSIVQECYILVQVQAPKSEIHSFSPLELKIWDKKVYLHEK